MSLLRTIDEHPLDCDHCFLCGTGLQAENCTKEHVVPHWAQKHFGIKNKKLSLLNRTCIPYHRAIVPCCSDCNGVALSPLEQRVRSATADDAPLAAEDAWLWSSKVFLGLHFLESRLRSNRQDPSSPPIVSADWLAHHRLMLLPLQQLRDLCTVTGKIGDARIFSVDDATSCGHGWDLWTDPLSSAIAVRIGRFGILATFADCGRTFELMGPMWRAKQQFPLHPIQFLELSARFFSISWLATCSPSYVIIEADESEKSVVLVVPRHEASLASRFGMSECQVFTQKFADRLGVSASDILLSNGSLLTYLEKDCEPIEMPLRDFPMSVGWELPSGVRIKFP